METLAPAREACFHSFTISLRSEHARQFIDITDFVLDGVRDAGIRNGFVTVTSQHTTASIIVNEHEPELLKDLDKFLARLAPDHLEYAHNAVPCGPDEHPNGHSHCQALLLTASTSVPVVDGSLMLGRFQRIFLVELDRSRDRRVSVAALGM